MNNNPIRLLLLLNMVCLIPALDADEKARKVTFDDDVMPVLEDACLNCHNPDEAKGGLDLTSFSATMTGGSGGQIVDPGNPDTSRLYTLAIHAEEPFMPPKKPKIEQVKLDVLKNWIAGGLLETKDSTARKSSSPTLKAVVEVSSERPKDPAMPKHVLLEPVVVTQRPNAITALASSPWAPLIAIGGQKQVILYDSDNLDLVGIFAFPEGFPEDLSFSRNGSILLAGGGRGGKMGKAIGWDVKTGERLVEAGREFDTALAADISPDHRFVTLGGPGRNIKIIDTQTGEQLHSIKKHPDWLLELEYSPDGVLFASGGRNGGLYIWEAGTGIEFYNLKLHQKAVTGLSWRSDSNVLAACSEDGQVSTWEMLNGKMLKKWAAHGGGALGIDFAPDGSKLVTCGRDNRVKIWDINGKLLREIKDFSDVVTTAIFTYDGKHVVSGDWNGSLVLWDAANGQKVGELISNPPSIVEQKKRAEGQIGEITADLPELEQALAKASQDLADGRKQHEAANLGVAEAKRLKGQREAEERAAAQAVAQAGGKVKQAEGQLQAKKQALAAKQKQADTKQTALDAKLKVLQQKRAELAKRNAETAGWKSRFADLENQLRSLSNQRGVAEKAVASLKRQVEQLPDNPDLKAKLAAAESGFGQKDTAFRNAVQERRELGGKIAANNKLAGALNGQIGALDRELKVAKLVVTNLRVEADDMQKAIGSASTELGDAGKDIKEAESGLATAKKAVADAANHLKAREAAAKAADDRAGKLAVAENAAKAKLDKAKVDLQFAKYQVDKWAAAEVNFNLHGESEVLENYREKMIRLDGDTEKAIAAHQEAMNAVQQAREQLARAQKTVSEGNSFLSQAKSEIVATRLELFAARAAADSEPGPGAPQIRDKLNDTFAKVDSTRKRVAEAARTAAKTPAIIALREKTAKEKATVMQDLLKEKESQKREVDLQLQKVTELKEKYEELYYEFPKPPANPK